MFKQLCLSVATVLTILGSNFSLADEPTKEKSLAFTFKDPQLVWGSCPPFMPKGCQIAVLHGDPSKENADVFFKVPAGSTVPQHWHTSPERMVLVSGKFHVTYEGQKEVVLKPGSYAYGPAKWPHKAFCSSKELCVLFIAFESPVDAVPVESPSGK